MSNSVRPFHNRSLRTRASTLIEALLMRRGNYNRSLNPKYSFRQDKRDRPHTPTPNGIRRYLQDPGIKAVRAPFCAASNAAHCVL